MIERKKKVLYPSSRDSKAYVLKYHEALLCLSTMSKHHGKQVQGQMKEVDMDITILTGN